MDLKKLLIDRRAIRDFQNKEVPLSVIKDILQDTRLAPTARNGQPCKFIIIQDSNYIKKLSDECKRNLLSDLEKDPKSPLKEYESRIRDERFNVFYNAPCLVCFIGSTAVQSLAVDCALTVAYFMFSAVTRGLGTCWIGMGTHIRDRQFLSDMGVPADCRIVAPIAVGYPTAIPAPSERHEPIILKVI